MAIFPEGVKKFKNFYRKNGETFGSSAGFPSAISEVGPVLSGRSIESDEFVAGRNWDGQLVVMERHGVFFCC